jgi:hypothetical protein
LRRLESRLVPRAPGEMLKPASIVRALRLTQLYSVTALCTPRSLSTSVAVAAANAREASVLAERRHVSTSTALSNLTSAAEVAAAVAEANDRAAAHLHKREAEHILRHAESSAPPLQAAAPAPAPAPQQGESLCVLDGHAIAYRMFHGMKTTDMKTSDGTPTYAISGFCGALLKMRELFPGYRMLVAFDSRTATFRSEVLPEYKANRPAMPEPMRVQMPRILEACTAFGVPQA